MNIVRRFAVATLTVALLLTLAVPAGAQESSCEAERAWPEGPHLSEKNAGIVELFFAVWGDSACQQWADEHRESAIKGLRSLGFKVERSATPVLQVNALTLRGRGHAQGEITLAPGCYIAWIDYTDRTPERRLAEGWDFWEETWERPWFGLTFSDPNEELYGYGGLVRYENEWGITGSDGIGMMVGVTNDDVPQYGHFDFTPEIVLAPGAYRWRVRMPHRIEGEDWEFRMIPNEYAVTPWNEAWAPGWSEWTPPCLIGID